MWGIKGPCIVWIEEKVRSSARGRVWEWSGQMKTDWWSLSESVHNTGWSGKALVDGWQESAGPPSSHPINIDVTSELAGAPELMKVIIKSQRKVFIS